MVDYKNLCSVLPLLQVISVRSTLHREASSRIITKQSSEQSFKSKPPIYLFGSTMSHLQYFSYKGFGEHMREVLSYSQAVRIGDRIEISGQGMLVTYSCSLSVLAINHWRIIRRLGSKYSQSPHGLSGRNQPSIRQRRASAQRCWWEGLVPGLSSSNFHRTDQWWSHCLACAESSKVDARSQACVDVCWSEPASFGGDEDWDRSVCARWLSIRMQRCVAPFQIYSSLTHTVCPALRLRFKVLFYR